MLPPWDEISCVLGERFYHLARSMLIMGESTQIKSRHKIQTLNRKLFKFPTLNETEGFLVPPLDSDVPGPSVDPNLVFSLLRFSY